MKYKAIFITEAGFGTNTEVEWIEAINDEAAQEQFNVLCKSEKYSCYLMKQLVKVIV